MTKHGFGKSAQTSSTPGGWRLDKRGRRVAVAEPEAKAARVAAALARVAEVERSKEARWTSAR